MKVFICWSGPTSKRLAEVFRDWLPAVIQAIKPYFSPEDVEKGARWYPEISKELEQCKAGLICLTRENLEAPWVMFEAGALSKNVERSRLVPLLFGIDPADIKGPLIQFQAAPFSKDEIKKLMKALNSALGEARLDGAILDSVFEKWWPELELNIQEVLKAEQPQEQVAKRSDRELLEEILDLLRTIYYEPKPKYYERRLPMPIINQGIDALKLIQPIRAGLKKLNINVVNELVSMSENDLIAKNVSIDIIHYIKEMLTEHGLHLGMAVPVG